MIIKPAKELALLLQTKVIIERAYADYIYKINGENKQLYLVSDQDNKFKTGPSISSDDNFSLTKEEAFDYLANEIKKLDRVRFFLLALPLSGAVDHVTVDINSNVIMRIIEYYDIMTDKILIRYDVLVEKVINQ